VFEGLEGRLLLSGLAYFVSASDPASSDANDGSYVHPWRTAQYAIDQVGPGDTVYLESGSDPGSGAYNESLTFHNSGTAGNPITLSGYTGYASGLLGDGLGVSAGIDLGTCDYITIRHLTIQGFTNSGEGAPAIIGQGGNDGIVLQNLDLNQCDAGIVLGASLAATSHNITIDTVHLYGLAISGITTDVGGVDGLGLSNSLIESDGATGSGVDLAGPNIAITNTTVSTFGGTGIALTGDHLALRRDSVNGCAVGMDLSGADVTVENSLSINNDGPALIASGAGSFNLSFNLFGGTVSNSTVILGNTAGPIAIAATGNIIYSNAASPLVLISNSASLSGDYNLYFSPNLATRVISWSGNADYPGTSIPSGAWASASGMDAHSLYTNPLLTSTYRLQSYSPAINYSPTGPTVDRTNSHRPVGSGFDLGPFEWSGKPDTTAPTVSAVSLYNVTNAGAATYDFKVTYTDNVAIRTTDLDGNDILVSGPDGFSQLARFVSVDVDTNGKPRTATYEIDAPSGAWEAADNGVYTLSLQANQVGDPSGNYVVTRDLGTFTVNAFVNPIRRFGDVDGARLNKITLADGDGTIVTFAISGPGTGVITAGASGGWDLNLVNTTVKTAVSIATKNSRIPGDDGRVVLQDINVNGDMKSLTGKTTDVQGDVTVTGVLAGVTLGDFLGTQSTFAITGAGGKTSLKAAFGQVRELSLEAPNLTVASLTATCWRDDDATSDEISVLRLGTLSVKGSKVGPVAGDFGADIVTTDAASAKPIGAIAVSGWIYGSTIRTTRMIGSITAGGLRDSNIFSSVAPAITDFAGVLAAGAGAFTAVVLPRGAYGGGSLASLKVTGIAGAAYSVINSSVAVEQLGAVSLLNVRTDNTASGGGAFGLAGTSIKSYVRKTGKVTTVKVPKRLGPATIDTGDLPGDQFIVRLF